MCSIFSYAGFLAADSGWVSTPDRAGYVAGLLATMLPLGRLPTSMLWGQYADAAGRRPALIGSMLGIAVGNLAFGFARSLWAALAVRFVLLGGCNGWNSGILWCVIGCSAGKDDPSPTGNPCCPEQCSRSPC